MKGELRIWCTSMLQINMLVKMLSDKKINDIWLRDVAATVELTLTDMKDDET